MRKSIFFTFVVLAATILTVIAWLPWIRHDPDRVVVYPPIQAVKVTVGDEEELPTSDGIAVGRDEFFSTVFENIIVLRATPIRVKLVGKRLDDTLITFEEELTIPLRETIKRVEYQDGMIAVILTPDWVGGFILTGLSVFVVSLVYLFTVKKRVVDKKGRVVDLIYLGNKFRRKVPLRNYKRWQLLLPMFVLYYWRWKGALLLPVGLLAPASRAPQVMRVFRFLLPAGYLLWWTRRRLIRRNIPAILRDWEAFYLEVFGLTKDFSRCRLPKPPLTYIQLSFPVAVAREITNSRLLEVAPFKEERLRKVLKGGNLDEELYSERDSRDGDYVILTEASLEPSSLLKENSADDLGRKNISTMTFRERILPDLFYYWKFGRHLDSGDYHTLCSGSYSRQKMMVPVVHWDDDEEELKLYFLRYDRRPHYDVRYPLAVAREIVSRLG